MAEGFDLRKVLQGVDPSGAVRQPVRQLESRAPNAAYGGTIKDYSNSDRLLREIGKSGDKFWKKYKARREEEDLVEAQLAYTQGTTEQQLIEAGASQHKLEAYRALQLKDASNKWLIQKKVNLDKDRALTPDQYRAQLMQEFKDDALNDVDLDPNTRKLKASFQVGAFNELMKSQMIAHTAYTQEQSIETTTNTLLSQSQVGNPQDLIDMVTNLNELTPALNDDQRSGVLASATRQSLTEGNFNLFDAAGGTKGLRKLGLNENQLNSVTKALEHAQSMEATSNFEEIQNRVDNLMLDIKGSNLSYEEAKDRLKDIQADYRTRPAYWINISKDVSSVFSNRDLDAVLANKMYNPEYRAEKAKILQETVLSGSNVAQAAVKFGALADKYDIPHDLLMNDLRAMDAADQRFQNKQIADVEKIANRLEKERQKDTKALALLSTNFSNLDEYSSQEQQRSFKLANNMIQQSIELNNPSLEPDEKQNLAIEKYVDFLGKAPILDKSLKKTLGSVINQSPLDQDGNLNPSHLGALKYMDAMRAQGISENRIKDYFGDAYDYVYISQDTAKSSDPVSAMTATYEMIQNPTDPSYTRTNTTEVMQDWDSIKEDFFNDIEPSMIGGWFGNNSDGTYDEVLTWQVTEAMQNSPDVDNFFKQKVDTYIKQYPNMNKTAIIRLAKRDLSQVEYVMGNAVVPKDGRTLSQWMGLEKDTSTLTANSAMIMYMSDNIDKIYPEGTEEEKAWWKKLFSPIDTVSEYLDKDAKLSSATKKPTNLSSWNVLDPRNFLEFTQMKANDIKMIDMRMGSRGNIIVSVYEDTDKEYIVGHPVTIPAKWVGNYYKQKRTEQQLDKQLVKRD